MAEFRAPAPLVLLAQAGDRRALEQLLAGVQEVLFDYLKNLVRDPHLAEDILQEVFVLIWRKLHWLREPELFRPWVYRIASREAFRNLKKERTLSRVTQHETALMAEAGAENLPSEWVERLPDLLADVSSGSRAVLILHYLQGLTLEEVAAALDLPAGTVKSRVAYGLSVLRKKLATKGGNWRDVSSRSSENSPAS